LEAKEEENLILGSIQRWLQFGKCPRGATMGRTDGRTRETVEEVEPLPKAANKCLYPSLA